MGKSSFGRTAGRVFLWLIAGMCLSMPAVSFAAPQARQLRVFPGEYIVQLKRPSVNAQQSASQARSSSAIPIAAHLTSDTYLVDTGLFSPSARIRSAARGQSVPYDANDTFCKRLLLEGAVSACAPNYEVRISADGINDPMYSSQWALNGQSGVSAPRAWEVTTGSSEVVVAVVDTGIDYTHEDLRANMWTNMGEVAGNGIDDDGNGYVDDVHGINAGYGVSNPGNPMDDNGHGTHVAGIIGAVGGNGKGIVGVNRRVKLMAVKFLDASGSGSLSDAIVALDYIVDLKARGVDVRVVNNSWGGGGYVSLLEEAVQRVRDAGLVFVAAAGNEAADNDEQPTYPAGFDVDTVVSVAAIDEQQNLAEFSNFGATSVDIAAPGVAINSTLPGNTYGKLSGTSMATPYVTGSVALLIAAEPGLSAPQAIERLYGSGRALTSLFDSAAGIGMVRTQRTVDVGRMVYNQTQPLPDPNGTGPLCEYVLSAKNVAGSNEIDTSADSQVIIQQSDEGDFQRVELPFAFPFYSTWLSSIFVSPNGVIYAEEPSIIDYRSGSTAPRNSIAALHTDLNPSSADQGVRVFKSADKVTIQWKATIYRAEAYGPVQVRLTLSRDGAVRSSVAFDPNRDSTEIKRRLLGDPFSTPSTLQGATIGITGSSSRLSSTLDTADMVKGLISSYDQDLVLGVSMTAKCKKPRRLPTVQSIRLLRVGRSQGSRAPVKVRGTVKGDADGPATLSFAVDSRRCAEAAQVMIGKAGGIFRASVPRGPSKVAVSSGNAKGTLRLSQERSGVRPGGGFSRARLCRALVRSVRMVSGD